MARDIKHIIRELWGNRRLGWDRVLSKGMSGGQISIWNLFIGEEALQEQRTLAIIVDGNSSDSVWASANVCRPNADEDRATFWDTMTNLNVNGSCLGCLVEILIWLSIHIEKGGRSTTRSMERFSDFINKIESMGLLLNGRRFKWTNNQEREAFAV